MHATTTHERTLQAVNSGKWPVASSVAPLPLSSGFRVLRKTASVFSPAPQSCKGRSSRTPWPNGPAMLTLRLHWQGVKPQFTQGFTYFRGHRSTKITLSHATTYTVADLCPQKFVFPSCPTVKTLRRIQSTDKHPRGVECVASPSSRRGE